MPVQFSIFAISEESAAPDRFRVVFTSHFHFPQCTMWMDKMEHFPSANRIDAMLPIVVYFRCCRQECRKKKIYYIHSQCVPGVLFDVPFNMHLSIENSLYLPFIVIYTGIGSRRRTSPSTYCRSVYSNQMSVFDSVPLQLLCALLSNRERNETHNGMKYISEDIFNFQWMK